MDLGFPTSYISFIFNLVSHREVHFWFNDIDCIRSVNKGLPQGSVLSPLLYSIYVSGLESAILDRSDARILQFADDICLYTCDKSTPDALLNLEFAANLTAKWLDEVGLTLAPQKSQLCIFNKSSKVLTNCDITVKGITIRQEPKVRFLGLILQSNLKWNSQIEKICDSCLKPINLMKFLRTTWWGADPTLLLSIYRSLIRSRIEYGSYIWTNIPQYLWNKLNGIQYQAIRLAMGYMKSTPTISRSLWTPVRGQI